MVFLSTPSARRATVRLFENPEPFEISIHALREEGDERAPPLAHRAKPISIHALREEGDHRTASSTTPRPAFLSTPSARRATLPSVSPPSVFPISIHALREEGDETLPPWRRCRRISIPALRVAGDRFWHGGVTLRWLFYPRPPRGGRRPTSRPTTSSRSNFYPRPPRGGRRLTASVLYKVSPFLSTPSARRATPVAVRTDHIKDYFYPRPPRGGRPTQSSTKWRGSYFYPRPPRGGRRADAPFQKKSTAFLSTPSARRATMTRGWTIPACHDFYPRPPRGGRLVLPDGWEVAPYFYPRPPRGGRQGKKWSDKEVIKISIHALREEGDQRNLCTGQHSRYFYPRPPRGGRRAEESVVFGVKAISIHALREEGDRAA